MRANQKMCNAIKEQFGKDITIIEMPFVKGPTANQYRIYQLLHGKRVKMGYSFNGKNLLKFGNLVETRRKKEIKKSGSKYIIIHKDIFEELNFTLSKDVAIELASHERRQKFRRYNQDAEESIKRMRLFFGKPVFEDRWITVFSVR